jgi:hypothetical protein
VGCVNLTPAEQIARWREVNGWIEKHFSQHRIPDAAFTQIEAACAELTPQSRLFFGFGDDGKGNSDPFLTGHIFVTYLVEKFPHERSRFVDFYPPPPDPGHFDFYRPITKIREGAADRPKGFYVKSLLPEDYEGGIGTTHKALSPADVRKLSPWGWGPEGFQLLAIETTYVGLLLEQKVPTFVLGDYAIAPYGGNEFYSTVILGPCRKRLEIGNTNSRDNIPKYAPSHLV